MTTITQKLTREEQADILGTLFGFSFYNDILLDEDGKEFYGHTKNCEFDFSTLAGIFSYQAHISKNLGRLEVLREIHRILTP